MENLDAIGNIENLCTDSVMQGEKIKQIPYFSQGSFVCNSCAENCRKAQGEKFELKQVYFFPYQCQCQHLKGGCQQKLKDKLFIDEKFPNIKLQDMQGFFKNVMNEKLIKMSTRDIAPNMLSQQQFEFRIESEVENAYLYNDELVQTVALSVIPPEIHQLQGQQVNQLKALLKWFKEDFFSWCNKPKCTKCKTNEFMGEKGSGKPNAEDREFHATKIEVYECNQCRTETRYPRYNHPIKLFETQTGRCGEWANAFTCICVALGYDARKANDWTDHVWTEVYIDQYQRWVHLDSCEPLFDAPLTYEQGWGKQLTYIIAVSSKEIVDVSTRYVIDPMMNRMRRDKVNEQWLAEMIKNRRESMWEMQGPKYEQILRLRYQTEYEELIGGSKADVEGLLPRQSGSLEWRSSRGEMGDDAMSMMAGYQDIKKIQSKYEEISKPAQNYQPVQTQQPPVSQSIGVIQPKKQTINLPKKEATVLFVEKQEKTKNLNKLIEQIQTGCCQIGCNNKSSCLTGNPNLHKDLGLANSDKQSIVMTCLRLQIEDKHLICDN